MIYPDENIHGREENLISAELYEVISLSSRYLFALLGILIVLRAFVWLLSDRAEKHARLRKLPDAGMIGELVVLSSTSNELSPGMSIPVPREGILGSVRSCDIVIPADHVNKSHLAFSFFPGTGLIVRPFRGCDVFVDGKYLDARSDEKARPLGHGSFLQIGETILRLRIFAGLDPNAGFDDSSDSVPVSVPDSDPTFCMPTQWTLSAQSVPPVSDTFPASGLTPSPGSVPASDYVSGSEFFPEHTSAGSVATPLSEFSPVSDSSDFPSTVNASFSEQKRRSDRWEADWSE